MTFRRRTCRGSVIITDVMVQFARGAVCGKLFVSRPGVLSKFCKHVTSEHSRNAKDRHPGQRRSDGLGSVSSAMAF